MDKRLFSLKDSQIGPEMRISESFQKGGGKFSILKYLKMEREASDVAMFDSIEYKVPSNAYQSQEKSFIIVLESNFKKERYIKESVTKIAGSAKAKETQVLFSTRVNSSISVFRKDLFADSTYSSFLTITSNLQEGQTEKKLRNLTL